MTKTKPRILIVGGEDRNITDQIRELLEFTQVEQARMSSLREVPKGTEAIVVITRFVSRSGFDQARKLSQKHKIPVVQASTGNYIVPQLIRFGILEAPDKPTVTRPLAKPEAHHFGPMASTETTIGIPSEQLWSRYGPRAIETIYGTMLPNEEEDESVLVDLLSSTIGLPENDVRLLFPELALRGVLIQKEGTTLWQRLGEHGEYDEQAKAPERPKKRAPRLKAHAGDYIQGLAKRLAELPPGRYVGTQHLLGVATERLRLVKKNGEPIDISYMSLLATAAVELGVLLRDDDGFTVPAPVEPSKIEPPKVEEKPPVKIELPPPAKPVLPKPIQPIPGMVEEKSKVVLSCVEEELPSGRRKSWEEKLSPECLADFNALPKMIRDTLATRGIPMPEFTLKRLRSIIEDAQKVYSMVRESGFDLEIPEKEKELAMFSKRLLRPEVWDLGAAETIRVFTETEATAFHLVWTIVGIPPLEWDALAWYQIRNEPLHRALKMFLPFVGVTKEQGRKLGMKLD